MAKSAASCAVWLCGCGAKEMYSKALQKEREVVPALAIVVLYKITSPLLICLQGHRNLLCAPHSISFSKP